VENNIVTIQFKINEEFNGLTSLYSIKKWLWHWDWKLIKWEFFQEIDTSNDTILEWLCSDQMEFKKDYEYHTLDTEWLLSYIRIMEELYSKKPRELKDYSKHVQWWKNNINVKIEWYFTEKNEYFIAFEVKNKYRARWTKDIIESNGEIYDPDWHGTDENFRGNSISLSKAHFWLYILQLVQEYELQIWNKYIWQYKEIDLEITNKIFHNEKYNTIRRYIKSLELARSNFEREISELNPNHPARKNSENKLKILGDLEKWCSKNTLKKDSFLDKCKSYLK